MTEEKRVGYSFHLDVLHGARGAIGTCDKIRNRQHRASALAVGATHSQVKLPKCVPYLRSWAGIATRQRLKALLVRAAVPQVGVPGGAGVAVVVVPQL